MAAAEQTEISVNHRLDMSQCCHTVVKKAHVIGGRVRRCMLCKASEVFLLLPGPVKLWMEPFLSRFGCFVLRKMWASSRESGENGESGQRAGNHEE